MLEGTIEANGVVVGRWEAKRVLTRPYLTHIYDCQVVYRNIKGYLLLAEFQVRHAEAGGPVALGAKILTKAQNHWKKVPLGTDKEYGI